MKARKRVLPTERGSQMVLSPIDYVIIALYFIVIVAIGSSRRGSRKRRKITSWPAGGCRFPCSSAAWPRSRWAAAPLSAAPAGLRVRARRHLAQPEHRTGARRGRFLVTSKLSKLRALSVNEVVESSYGPIARVFSSALTLIYTLTLSVVQVISIGTIINGVTGIDATLSMLVGGGIVILYTFVGGCGRSP